MEINNVPQDNSSTYANNKKAIYALDDGKAKVVASSGWDAEETATKQALQDLDNSAKEAYCEVKNGSKSPLYYYMYSARMDLDLLAQTTGFFKWTIKRDFKPEIFTKMKEERSEMYADVLGVSVDNLKRLEEKDYECN